MPWCDPKKDKKKKKKNLAAEHLRDFRAVPFKNVF